MIEVVLILLIAFLAFAFYAGRSRALNVVDGALHELHSLPNYYGWFTLLSVAIPAIGVLILWNVIEPRVIERSVTGEVANFADLSIPERQVFMNDVKTIAEEGEGGIVTSITDEKRRAAEAYQAKTFIGDLAMAGVAFAVALLAFAHARSRVAADFRARNKVEGIVKAFLVVCSAIAILTTLGIVLSLIFETARFFGKIPFTDFLFGLNWSPQTAIRPGQVAAQGAFGAIPLFTGTLLITAIAMTIAVPIGLFSAIYLSDYASATVRGVAKPLLEVLAGIPTVVYGFFAAITVAPAIRNFGESVGLDVASESALAAGAVMGVMIIPFVSSLSDDVINAVPQSLRDGSYGLGATKSETIRKVILPAALPGIVGAVLLAISRAVGETMIVVMAAGLAANLTANPLEAVTTVTVQIVTLLVGDQEFDSAKTLAAFALGMVLFIVTLALNYIALRVVQRYREKYD